VTKAWHKLWHHWSYNCLLHTSQQESEVKSKLNTYLSGASYSDWCSICGWTVCSGMTVHCASCLLSTLLLLTTVWKMGELHSNSSENKRRKRWSRASAKNIDSPPLAAQAPSSLCLINAFPHSGLQCSCARCMQSEAHRGTSIHSELCIPLGRFVPELWSVGWASKALCCKI